VSKNIKFFFQQVAAAAAPPPQNLNVVAPVMPPVSFFIYIKFIFLD
jgi:hypothetical protein